MRSLRERIIHTALFEVLAVAIVTPSLSALTGVPMTKAGTLSLLISAGATVSNYLWTMLFDRWVPTRRRSVLVRVAQAIGLEAIITSFTIPLVMYFTAVSFWKAVALDIGAISFFIVFTIGYNAAFDAVMIRLSERAA